MKSERRRIQNLFKHLRRSVFAQTVNGLKSLTEHAKTLHLRCLKGFWICFCWKQGKCKVYKRTLDAAKYNINLSVYVLKYFKDISQRLTAPRVKIYELVLLNNIFVQLFWSSFGSFFLVFTCRRLSVTFNIQIDLKMKHL